MAQGCDIAVSGWAQKSPLGRSPRFGRGQLTSFPRSLRALAVLALILLGIGPTLRVAAEPPDRSSFVQGVAAYQRGDWESAAAEFSKYLEIAPPSQSRRDALFYLAEVHVQLGTFDQAHRQYDQYLQQSDNDPPAMVIRARFRLGESSFQLQDYVRATVELESFLALHPDDALASRAREYLAQIGAAKSNSDLDHEIKGDIALNASYDERMTILRQAIRQGDADRAVVLVEDLLNGPESCGGELRRQVAQIGFRQWLELGDERRAIETYLQGQPATAGSSEVELRTRREMAAELESIGLQRHAVRERARCQQVERIAAGTLDRSSGDRNEVAVLSP